MSGESGVGLFSPGMCQLGPRSIGQRPLLSILFHSFLLCPLQVQTLHPERKRSLIHALCLAHAPRVHIKPESSGERPVHIHPSCIGLDSNSQSCTWLLPEILELHNHLSCRKALPRRPKQQFQAGSESWSLCVCMCVCTHVHKCKMGTWRSPSWLSFSSGLQRDSRILFFLPNSHHMPDL